MKRFLLPLILALYTTSAFAQGTPVVIRDSNGTEKGTATQPLRVDPTGSTTQPVSAASLPLPTGAATESTLNTLLAQTAFTGRFPSGASPADGESNTNTSLSRIGVFHFFYNGTTWDRARGDTTNGMWVNVKSSVAVTANAGTGNFTVVQPTGTNLHMVCDSGCSSSTAPADESAFTAGTTSFGLTGGFFQTTATNNALTTGQMGAFQVTAQRALFTNLRNASGTEMGTSSNPLQVTLANTGANATAVKVDGSAVTQPVSIGSTVTVTGSGTAGSAASGVLSVQGIASMTPLDENLKQVGGTAVDTNSGNKSAGTQRTVLATDSPSIANYGQGATGSAPPAAAVYVGGLQSGATGGLLGGVPVCDTSKVINISTATTTLLVTGVSGRKIHVCSLFLVAAAADNVAFIEGTTASTPCDTSTAGVTGGTTAASGLNLAANGGLTIGSGFGEVMTTATAANNLCVVTSAATQLSGHMRYAIY